jgi:hypothetical protein
MSATKRDVLVLYRRIVRESRRLEPDARQYYLRFARSVRSSPYLCTIRINRCSSQQLMASLPVCLWMLM